MFSFLPLAPLPSRRSRASARLRARNSVCPRPIVRFQVLYASQAAPQSPPPSEAHTELKSTAETSCGFTALFGPSNSGKSTLLNRLIGNQLAIVSPRVQTTRCRIAGISIHDQTQLVFLDTPGIFEATNRLSRAMVKSAWSSYRDADAAVLILDGLYIYRRSKMQKESEQMLTRLNKGELCICVNKIDAVPRRSREKVHEIVKNALEHAGLHDATTFYISALHRQGLDTLLEWVLARMPKGPWLYDDDVYTDMPARMLAAEVTREKTFFALHNELPYEIAVETTSYKEQKDGSIRITQDIYVKRNSQKRIVTGTDGAVVKKIGMSSRLKLGNILGVTVHLMLTVKVRQDWKEDKWQYDQWGLDYNA